MSTAESTAENTDQNTDQNTDASWAGRTADGMVFAQLRDGVLFVDRPGQGTFGEAAPAPEAGSPPVVDDVTLGPVCALPRDLTRRAGWYETTQRTVLLTQIPETYFGAPMVLLAEDDRIVRAHPLDQTHLIDEDGRMVELLDGALRLDGTTLARSTHYAEHQVTFTSGRVELAGTFIVPPGEGPHPAAVLVHGAAGGQRDWCRIHATPILAAGVAVLIYDKPGHGLSGGAEPSTFEQADAAEAALDLLASRLEVDATRIGLAGFSNGMWAAPMVAARRDVAFVAGVGSPGVSMTEAEVHRRVKVLRESGVGADSLAVVAEAWRCLFSVVATGPSADVVARLGEALTTLGDATDLDRYELPDFVRENPALSPIPPLVPVADLVEMIGSERDPQMIHDPACDYTRISCPILLQYGADDTSVPVEASVTAVTAAAVHADVRVHPGLEHLLNVLPTHVTGLTPEAVMYEYHDFRFGSGVRDELTDWLRSTLFHSEPEAAPVA